MAVVSPGTWELVREDFMRGEKNADIVKKYSKNGVNGKNFSAKKNRCKWDEERGQKYAVIENHVANHLEEVRKKRLDMEEEVRMENIESARAALNTLYVKFSKAKKTNDILGITRAIEIMQNNLFSSLGIRKDIVQNMNNTVNNNNQQMQINLVLHESAKGLLDC